jgi:hypothetical protein
MEAKRQEGEAYQSPLTRVEAAEMKRYNMLRFTSTSSLCFNGVITIYRDKIYNYASQAAFFLLKVLTLLIFSMLATFPAISFPFNSTS